MSTDDTPDALTPAERRLAEHLELLRSSPPISAPELLRQIVRAARWQRAVREPLILMGAMAAALSEALRVFLEQGRKTR